MLRINMSQQYAKINMDIKDPKLILHTTLPKIEMHTEAAKVEITSGSGELSIDTTPCRESYGIFSNTEFARDCARRGKETALETIGRMAQEGDRLMRIESHEDAIVNIAIDNMSPQEFDVEWMPKNPPTIEYRPRPVRYRPVAGKVDVRLHWGSVENNSEPGTVTVTMAQYNKLNIWVTGTRDMRA